jgi:hypothetical protein
LNAPLISNVVERFVGGVNTCCTSAQREREQHRGCDRRSRAGAAES